MEILIVSGAFRLMDFQDHHDAYYLLNIVIQIFILFFAHNTNILICFLID